MALPLAISKYRLHMYLPIDKISPSREARARPTNLDNPHTAQRDAKHRTSARHANACKGKQSLHICIGRAIIIAMQALRTWQYAAYTVIDRHVISVWSKVYAYGARHAWPAQCKDSTSQKKYARGM